MVSVYILLFNTMGSISTELAAQSTTKPVHGSGNMAELMWQALNYYNTVQYTIMAQVSVSMIVFVLAIFCLSLGLSFLCTSCQLHGVQFVPQIHSQPLLLQLSGILRLWISHMGDSGVSGFWRNSSLWIWFERERETILTRIIHTWCHLDYDIEVTWSLRYVSGPTAFTKLITGYTEIVYTIIVLPHYLCLACICYTEV